MGDALAAAVPVALVAVASTAPPVGERLTPTELRLEQDARAAVDFQIVNQPIAP